MDFHLAHLLNFAPVPITADRLTPDLCKIIFTVCLASGARSACSPKHQRTNWDKSGFGSWGLAMRSRSLPTTPKTLQPHNQHQHYIAVLKLMYVFWAKHPNTEITIIQQR